MHPVNRYPDHVRERVETHLEIVLRADPGANDGVPVYRVYSHEINTNEKPINAIGNFIEEDDGVNVQLSSSTLQRMINDYLKAFHSRIKFLQSDHNACPTCKTLQYALLQFSYEIKSLEAKTICMGRSSQISTTLQEDLNSLKEVLTSEQYQE